MQLVKGKFRAAESEEVERLSETEEVAIQSNDDEQTPNDLLAWMVFMGVLSTIPVIPGQLSLM